MEKIAPTESWGAGDAAGDLLEVRHVSVQFGSLAAVQNVSFDLRRGEMMGLIGPNGAGKTTLLRAIAGLQETSGGAIRIAGLPAGRAGDPYCARFGFTPDIPAAYPQMSVRNFLRFIGRGYNLSRNETTRRIDFWLEKLWLSEKSKSRISTLSRGMRQRLGIARTLLPDPDVILLDEPAAGLDPTGRIHFRDLLIFLRDIGKCLVVSSHILSDLAEYCTHVGIMSRGQMLRFGTVDQVAGAADGTRTRYGVLLARPTDTAVQVAGAIAGTSGVELKGDLLSLEFHAGKEAASVLLAHLVEARLPVAAFFPELPNLERAYLAAFTDQPAIVPAAEAAPTQQG